VLASRYDANTAGVLGIAAVAIAGLIALANPSTWSVTLGKPVADGSWTSAYGKQFDGSLLIRDPAITGFGIFNYMLFGDGRRGVVVGKDGWLFSDEEFTPTSKIEPLIAPKLAYIREVHARLRARNVDLVVALLPSKLRVYGEKAGDHPIPTVLKPVYTELLNGIRSAGITAPDLLSVMMAGKARDQLFLRTDTHWTPGGAALVAAAVAREAKAHGLISGADWPHADFRLTPGGRSQHSGDLLKFLPLGSLQSTGPAVDLYPDLRGSEANDANMSLGDALLTQKQVPITLVGTSYSFNQRWRFEDALKAYFKSDLVNAAQEGRGPLKPMETYLDSPDFRNAPPRLVVWEIPERYLWSSSAETGLPQ